MRWILIALLLIVPAELLAQHEQEEAEHMEHHATETAGLDEAEIAGLLAGAGMGQALAAELNGYPGPKHVVELAQELELSDDQLAQAQQLVASTVARSKELGMQIVHNEKTLDAAFADGAIDAEKLSEMVAEIGRLRAELRLNHLSAHLTMAGLLSQEQRDRYSELRGYSHEEHQGS
jgi:Spy/CpxP family protein refolding chaperone